MAKMTPKNMHLVLSKLSVFLAEENEESRKFFCDEFNEWLDSDVFADFFGTEGQCDPRGDRRND